MAILVVSAAAQLDFDDIWFYIAQDQIINADRYIDHLSEKANLLSESPRMGIPRSELRPSLYSFPVDDYVMFYRIIEGGVELARVLSAARDLSNVFE